MGTPIVLLLGAHARRSERKKPPVSLAIAMLARRTRTSCPLASLIQRTYSALCEGSSFANAAAAAGREAKAFFSSPGIGMSATAYPLHPVPQIGVEQLAVFLDGVAVGHAGDVVADHLGLAGYARRIMDPSRPLPTQEVAHLTQQVAP